MVGGKTFPDTHTRTGLGHVMVGGEAFLDGRTDGRHRDDVGEADVAEDGPSHQPAALVVPVDVRRDVDGHRVRPWDAVELRLPSVEDDRHEEAEYERERDEAVELVAVLRHRLKHPAAHVAGRSTATPSQTPCSTRVGCRVEINARRFGKRKRHNYRHSFVNVSTVFSKK